MVVEGEVAGFLVNTIIHWAEMRIMLNLGSTIRYDTV